MLTPPFSSVGDQSIGVHFSQHQTILNEEYLQFESRDSPSRQFLKNANK